MKNESGSAGTEDKKIAQIDKIMLSLESTSKQTAVITQCEGDLTNNQFEELLDKKRFLIGFTNGVYDLNTDSFRNGTPDDYVSMNVGYDYNEEKMNEQEIYDEIMEFLDKVFPQEGVLHYVLKFLSTCLTGYTKEQLIHLGVGTGSNGKSMLLSLMAITLGKYAQKMESTFICGSTPDANSPTPALTAVVGSRFVYFSEFKKGAKLNEQLFKSLCGEDKFRYRPLYGESKEFQPDFKLFMICNPTELPTFDGSDHAMIRRIRVIPFVSTFTNDTQENEDEYIFMKDSTISEKINNWKHVFIRLLLHYYKLYINEGLIAPIYIKKASNKYSMNNNLYEQYIKECLVVTNLDEDKIRASELYKHFRNWIKEQGLPSNSSYVDNCLGSIFIKLLPNNTRNNVGRFYLNIKIKSNTVV